MSELASENKSIDTFSLLHSLQEETHPHLLAASQTEYDPDADTAALMRFYKLLLTLSPQELADFAPTSAVHTLLIVIHCAGQLEKAALELGNDEQAAAYKAAGQAALNIYWERQSQHSE